MSNNKPIMSNEELDNVVKQYLSITNNTRSDEKLRGILFKKVYNQYLPLIKNNFNHMKLAECNMPTALSIYSSLILYAISKWKQKSSFGTYLFMHLKPFKTLLSKELSCINKAGTHFSSTSLSLNTDDLEEE